MTNINLKSIKSESVSAVFFEITREDKISRLELSHRTGLSLMTVGKIADTLLEKEIVVQSKQNKTEVGRKAGLVSLNRRKVIAVVDLTTPAFKTLLFDISLVKLDEYVYSAETKMSPGGAFCDFLERSRDFVYSKASAIDLIGVSFSTPGPYNEQKDCISSRRVPTLNGVHIAESFKKVFGADVLFTISGNVRFGAMAHIRAAEDYRSKIIVYLHIGDGVSGAVSIHGEMLGGPSSFTGEFGQTTAYGVNGVVEDVVNSPEYSKAEKNAAVAALVHDIIWVFDPNIVIIESERDDIRVTPQTVKSLFKFTDRSFPEIVDYSSDRNNIYAGACMTIRDQWIKTELV